MDILINEKLHEEEIKKHKIVATELEINDEINRIARQNQATAAQVESYIRSNGGNWKITKRKSKKGFSKRNFIK